MKTKDITPIDLASHVAEEVFEHIDSCLDWGIDGLNDEYITDQDMHELKKKAYKLLINNLYKNYGY
mgnify:CR=1 FL=1